RRLSQGPAHEGHRAARHLPGTGRRVRVPRVRPGLLHHGPVPARRRRNGDAVTTTQAPLVTPSSLDETVRLANTDGELQLHSHSWTGTVTLLIDEDSYRITVDRGRFGLAPAESVTAAADGDDVTVSGAPETWAQLLAPVPPPGFATVFGACYF